LNSDSKLTFDAPFYQQGLRFLCGIDEAGRGPLAGPVVAAAVIFEQGKKIPRLNDSKKLTAPLREELYAIIKRQAVGFGIGLASVEEIDRLNILQATFLAMKRAVEQLPLSPDYVLVDGRDFPLLVHNSRPLPGTAVVKGDARSEVIAAASILAKVFRDRFMIEQAAHFPLYRFERHKGYGTAEHRALILKYGPCPLHRKKFIRSLVEPREEKLF